MENNLYYTPTIEELAINQEIYLLDTSNYTAGYTKEDIYPMLVTITELTDYPTIWVKTKETNKGFKTYEVYPQQIGLKHLDQADIESLGWKFGTNDYVFPENKNVTYGQYKLLFNNNELEIIHLSGTLFRGNIKNKSELIKLMQQLNIK